MQTRSSAQYRSLLTIVTIAFVSCALPPSSALADTAEESGLFKFGQADLKWFGMSIYSISLWSEEDASLDKLYENDLILSIRYDRDVSKERILKTTRKEWKRLDGRLDESETEWLKVLEGIFPDVSEGDILASRMEPGKDTRFYLGKEQIGTVNDPAFGPAFFAIWLDPNTSQTRMRDELLYNFPALPNTDKPVSAESADAAPARTGARG